MTNTISPRLHRATATRASITIGLGFCELEAQSKASAKAEVGHLGRGAHARTRVLPKVMDGCCGDKIKWLAVGKGLDIQVFALGGQIVGIFMVYVVVYS